MFEQKIVNGFQVEQPDFWLVRGNPFEIERPDIQYEVNFGGRQESYTKDGFDRKRWIPKNTVIA